ncbi:hypothetical protein [Reyranella massiliensis]|uniref:hypothetical protein n=1 Tax=Reyranella massiliensis TaxID=445220 RepID=UPI0011D1D0F1|nr:hypothetical protein [Reyranella massiliensis]
MSTPSDRLVPEVTEEFIDCLNENFRYWTPEEIEADLKEYRTWKAAQSAAQTAAETSHSAEPQYAFGRAAALPRGERATPGSQSSPKKKGHGRKC